MLDQIAREQAGLVKIVKINTQREGRTATQLGVRAVPTFMLFKNGQKLIQSPGALSKSELERWIQNAASSA